MERAKNGKVESERTEEFVDVLRVQLVDVCLSFYSSRG